MHIKSFMLFCIVFAIHTNIQSIVVSEDQMFVLCKAAFEGKYVILQQYRKEGLINAVDSRGYTALTRIAGMCQKVSGHAMVNLIAHGASLDGSDGFQTPLNAVFSKQCKCCWEETASFLLRSGANIEKTDAQGQTALHKAASEGWLNVLRFLIFSKKGKIQIGDNYYEIPDRLGLPYANKNALDTNKMTPLMMAASNGNVECVQTLVGAGADLEIKDENDLTALHYAVCKKHPMCISALVSNGANVASKAKNGWTVFHWVAHTGNVDVLPLLPVQEQVINEQALDGLTPLMLAVRKGDVASCKALIEKGADINVRDNKGFTLLHQAAQKDHVGVLELLLARGLEVDAVDDRGITPLMVPIALNENSACIEQLVKAGADINKKNNTLHNPLLIALIQGNADIVNLLLRNGADPNMSSDDGRDTLKAILCEPPNKGMQKERRACVLSMIGWGAIITSEQAKYIRKSAADVAFVAACLCLRKYKQQLGSAPEDHVYISLSELGVVGPRIQEKMYGEVQKNLSILQHGRI